VIAKWETGERSPKNLEDLARCEERLETRGILTRLLNEWVAREITHEWLWELQAIEERATSLLSFQNSVIEGLLQLPDYARAVLQAGEQPPTNVDAKVAIRIERQEILNESPPQLVAIMAEPVLRWPIGGAKVMHEQLLHLVEMAERPEIIIQVVPMSVGAYTGLHGPFVIASVDGSEVAYVEDAIYGRVIHDPENIAALKRLWYPLASKALSEEASIQLIMEVAKSYEMA
jgi:hypothetical protein